MGLAKAVLPSMLERGSGHFVAVSSLAGKFGTPLRSAYAAAKHAIIGWHDCLRAEVYDRGLRVTVVCPGFVRSRMTDVNDFSMPFLMEAERAAEIILRGLARNRGRIAFPWPPYFWVWLLGTLPTPMTDRLLSRLPKKASSG